MTTFTVLLAGDITPTARLAAQIAGTRVIAADSGMRHAAVLGLAPELWLGDFDSASDPLLAAHGEVPRLVTHEVTGYLSDGSATDLAAGIAWAIGRTHDEVAETCAGAVAHLSAAQVLEPFYEMHRLLSPSR